MPPTDSSASHPKMSTGFTDGGRRYRLTDPDRIRTADADLWNDRMYMQIDQRGRVLRSGFLTPDIRHYADSTRSFYLRDNESGEIWTVPPGPVRSKADTFEFSAGLSDLRWILCLHDIRCTVRLTLAPEDPVEIWSVKVTNTGTKQRNLSLFPYLPFGKLSWLRQSAAYNPELQGIVLEYMPYYVKYEDYETLKDDWNHVYALANRSPDACMCSVEDFIGDGTPAVPEALQSPRLPAPDTDFNAYVNHWQSRRSLMLVRGMRFMSAPQGRNLLQDAMGGALIDPACSRKRFLCFYAFQHSNGWLPHGMPLEPDATQMMINTIPHKDINSWGPSALTYYLYETGDESLLDEQIAFADEPAQSASLYQHICLGLEWLLADRGAHGLCRIGQGDWNDPLNMAGYLEKGESVWLSQALALALDTWAPVCDRRGENERADSYRLEADQLRNKINEHAWDGQWYIRGFTDEGKAFGSAKDTEGSIFLNPQSWAIMAGAADETRIKSCLQSVEEMLNTPSGPMTLAPAFTSMRTDIGKLTQKIPGTLENGSVYCHAVTFYAYALYQVRHTDRAFDILRNLISGSEKNPLERSGQLPLYIPNAYLGLPCGRKAGQSTHSPNSGTAAWFYRTLVDGLFGLRAEFDGLRVDPQLPSHWSEARAVRRWRGSVYEVQYSREANLKSTRVELDGVVCSDNLILPDSTPGTHQVQVYLPVD